MIGKLKTTPPELVALWAALALVLACLLGLTATLGAPPWVPWGIGLALSAFAALRLLGRVLDERSAREARGVYIAAHTPDPPARPQL
jgi:hypothetical protein